MNRKGQALVEFVLILPIFILILFSVVDFGLILSRKSQLENISADIVGMVKNGDSVDTIKNEYPKLDINIKQDNNYIEVEISDSLDIMTPGLNRVLGDPYKITVERKIPNDKA